MVCLYRSDWTDDEDIVYEYKHCLSLNGINIALTESDALDRAQGACMYIRHSCKSHANQAYVTAPPIAALTEYCKLGQVDVLQEVVLLTDIDGIEKFRTGSLPADCKVKVNLFEYGKDEPQQIIEFQ